MENPDNRIRCDVATGAGFETNVRYQAALNHQNMAIAHRFPKQKRSLGYALRSLCVQDCGTSRLSILEDVQPVRHLMAHRLCNSLRY